MTESQETTPTKTRRATPSKKPRPANVDAALALTPAPVPTTAVAAARPPAAEIAVRAYAIYVRRGRVDGRDQEDWLLAEAELAASAARGAAQGHPDTTS